MQPIFRKGVAAAKGGPEAHGARLTRAAPLQQLSLADAVFASPIPVVRNSSIRVIGLTTTQTPVG